MRSVLVHRESNFTLVGVVNDAHGEPLWPPGRLCERLDRSAIVNILGERQTAMR
jgi:hypothetical protein